MWPKSRVLSLSLSLFPYEQIWTPCDVWMLNVLSHPMDSLWQQCYTVRMTLDTPMMLAGLAVDCCCSAILLRNCHWCQIPFQNCLHLLLLLRVFLLALHANWYEHIRHTAKLKCLSNIDGYANFFYYSVQKTWYGSIHHRTQRDHANSAAAAGVLISVAHIIETETIIIVMECLWK